MAEQHQRQIGVLLADELREGPDRVESGPVTSRSEPAETAMIATPLPQTGAPVAAVIVGVDRVPVGDQGVDERTVATGVLADPVQQLHDGPRLARFMNVVTMEMPWASTNSGMGRV